MTDKSTMIGMVGDLLVDRDKPDEAFDLIRNELAAPDLLIGNCECAYADSPEISPGVTVPVTANPRNISAFANAGFDILTLANNHAVDAGHKGLFEMHGHLENAGIKHCGTGTNIREARKPAIADVDGLKIAVLSYATFFPRGYEALEDWPGLAPIRSFTECRDKLPNVWSPGTPPIVKTIPHEQDLENLKSDILSARTNADIVIVQLHSGSHHRPFLLSEWELFTARFAVDQGAHAVAAHQHHILHGAEWYKGAPIFYGLGHFVFDLHTFRGPKELVPDREPVDPDTDDSYDLAPRLGWPLLPWHRDARMTMIAWVTVTAGKVDAAGFLPCMLNRQGQVYPVAANSPEGEAVREYVGTGCESSGLHSSFKVTERSGFGGIAVFEMTR